MSESLSNKNLDKLNFIESFSLSGAAAVIAKTCSAPIERVKLLVQNQDEMVKQGRLATPYKGVIDCTVRTYQSEGKRRAAIGRLVRARANASQA